MSAEVQPLIYLVDDESDLLSFTEQWLEDAGMAVDIFRSGESCLEALTQELPSAVCIDLNMPGLGGLATIERIREHHPLLPIIVVTGDGTAQSAVRAMKLGARDYLTKPLDRTKLVTTLRNAVDYGELARRISQLEREARGQGYPGIIGNSPAMKSVFRQLDQLALSDVTVMILGESGTGKELIAKAIHQSSSRRKAPFVAINSSAIPETLLESELFGHEKGAFTGALGSRVGRFEEVDGGTLFLDEIGELSPPVQVKLLRVLQERSFQRLGGSRLIRSNFRLVTATHRDLAAEVKAGRFREDLFFRLAVFELSLPPLRSRKTDIPALAESFLQCPLHSGEPKPKRLSAAALGMLMEHSWPGNVRELQNVMQRAMVVAEGEEIKAEDLPSRVRPSTLAIPGEALHRERLEEHAGSLEELSKLVIVASIAKHMGNASAVMRELKISRPRFYRMLRKFGLEEHMSEIRHAGKETHHVSERRY